MQTGKTVLTNIQAARALAALLVVFYHLSLPGFTVGSVGVDIFFVISGFIMSYVAPGESRQFMLRRIARIAPLYWLLTIAIYLVAVYKPQWLNSTTALPEYLIKSMLFIPYAKDNGVVHPLLGNGWTLNFEMYFYAVVALALLVFHKKNATMTAAVALAIISAALNLIPNPSQTIEFVASPIVLEFGLGVLCFRLVQNRSLGWVTAPSLIAVAAVSLAAALVGNFYRADVGNGMVRVVFLGIPAFFFILSIILLEGQGYRLRSSTMLTLGNASYSIYLLHPYVIGVVHKILKLSPDLSSIAGIAAALASIIVTCAAAVICFKLIENPVSRWLSRAISNRSERKGQRANLSNQL